MAVRTRRSTAAGDPQPRDRRARTGHRGRASGAPSGHARGADREWPPGRRAARRTRGRGPASDRSHGMRHRALLMALLLALAGWTVSGARWLVVTPVRRLRGRDELPPGRFAS